MVSPWSPNNMDYFFVGDLVALLRATWQEAVVILQRLQGGPLLVTDGGKTPLSLYVKL